MPARRAIAVKPVVRAQVMNLDDPQVSRAVDQVRAAAQTALDRRRHITLIANLAIGANVVQHGLGYAPEFVGVMPTVADVTFAYGVSARTDKTVTINVLNVAQPSAGILLS